MLDVGRLGLLQKTVDQDRDRDRQTIDDLRIESSFYQRLIPNSQPLGLDFGRNGDAIVVAEVFFGATQQDIGEIPVFPVMNFRC